MKVTARVHKILANYESDCPGTKANLARILMHGKLGGTGRLVILPVDQGFEHGPARSFAPNPHAYDPHYHYQLAIDAGLSAYAAPLGMIEAGADSFAGAIPTILKVNSANSHAVTKDQAVTASVHDVLKWLGRDRLHDLHGVRGSVRDDRGNPGNGRGSEGGRLGGGRMVVSARR